MDCSGEIVTGREGLNQFKRDYAYFSTHSGGFTVRPGSIETKCLRAAERYFVEKSALHAIPYDSTGAIEKINTPRVMPVATPASSRVRVKK